MSALSPSPDSSRFVTLPAGPMHAHATPAAHGPLSIEYRWLNGRPGRLDDDTNSDPNARHIAPSTSSAPNTDKSGTSSARAPLLVFLHEGLGSIAMWRDWPQALCDALGARGLVYSRPGYGRSTPRARATQWPATYLEDHARDVLPALLAALNVDDAQRARMWLVGHSDGGSIALLYASLFPNALAGAIVIAPHEFVEDIALAGIAKAKEDYEQKDLREKLARFHADVDSAFYGWNDAWLSPAFRTWNIVDKLGAIRAPLLAIQGVDDHYGTMAQIDTIAQQVAHARQVKLDNCGHSPHREAPDRLTDAIVRFMKSVRPTQFV